MLELPPFYVERNKTKLNNQGHTLEHWCCVLGTPGFTRQEENEVLRGDRAILEKRLTRRADLADGVHLPLVTETQD